MSDDPNDPTFPTSLLPYDTWLEDAHRGVVLQALDYLCQHGLPGEHHFYMTFLTHAPGVDIPVRLKERYPEEMTIVLQHQFLNPTVDKDTQTFSVGLSFGGVPSTLRIPLKAITAFADPHIQIALRFSPDGTAPDFEQDNGGPELYQEEHPGTEMDDPSHEQAATESQKDDENKEAEVVSLAAFRKKHTKTETPPDDGGDPS